MEPVTSRELLDMMKARIAALEGASEPVSDYRIWQVLKLNSRTIVSGVRTGKHTWGDDAALKIAEILDVSEEYILATIQAERAERTAQNVAVVNAWKKIARGAALGLTISLLPLPSVTPNTSAHDVTKIYIMRRKKTPARGDTLELPLAA